MEKIFLLNPPVRTFLGRAAPLRHVANSMPSLGLCSLGAALRQDGWTVSLLDAAASGLSRDECLASIEKFGPDIVGFTTYTSTMQTAEEMARFLRHRYPSLTLIMGGPHVSAIARIAPELITPEIDFAVIGEGDITLVELAAALRAKGNPESVAGLMVANQACWKWTGERALISDLDSLPDPAWDLLPGFPDAYRPPVFSYTQGPAAPLCSSRGCPFSCSFCDHSVFGRHFRIHSVDRILEMIERLVRDHGVRHILFVDDNLSVQVSRLRDLCQRLIAEKLPINWTADIRADSLDVEDFALMKAAGCVRINCGLETGDPELLSMMSKDLDWSKVERTVHAAARNGLQVKGLFMIGFPGESPRSIKRTRDFLRSAPLDEINVSKFAPYPGTAWYEHFREERDHREFWTFLDGMHFSDTSLEKKQWLHKSFRDVLVAFYSRPRTGLGYIRNMVHFHESRKRIFAFLREYGTMMLPRGR